MSCLKKRCVIVSAGEMYDYEKIRTFFREDDFVIAADGGLRHLNRLGIPPHVFLGDMDSVDKNEPSPKNALVFPVQKDDTDTMLAIREGLKRGFTEFLLLGALGGRLDHSYANIQSLAFLLDNGARGEILSEEHRVLMLEKGGITVGDRYENISVFSYTQSCKGVWEENVEYPLSNAALDQGFPLGVSNHPLNENARISVSEGRLLLILSNG